MFKKKKGKRRKSKEGSGTIEGATKEKAGILHKEKYTRR